jgi:hypothetical protein
MTFNPARHGLSALSPDPASGQAGHWKPACSPTARSTPGGFITHHFGLDEFEEAYDVFARGADTGALKVVRTRRGTEKK